MQPRSATVVTRTSPSPSIGVGGSSDRDTTPVHGHAALFGVYGMLGIGLMLFCFRALRPSEVWREGSLGFAFWAINGGLTAMILFSLLPVGLMQTWATVEHGYWFARSPEFMQTGVMQSLRWARVLGDTLFAVGIVSLGVFVAGLATGWSLQRGTAWSRDTGGSALGNPRAHV